MVDLARGEQARTLQLIAGSGHRHFSLVVGPTGFNQQHAHIYTATQVGRLIDEDTGATPGSKRTGILSQTIGDDAPS